MQIQVISIDSDSPFIPCNGRKKASNGITGGTEAMPQLMRNLRSFCPALTGFLPEGKKGFGRGTSIKEVRDSTVHLKSQDHYVAVGPIADRFTIRF